MNFSLKLTMLLATSLTLIGCAGNPSTGGSGVVIMTQGKEITIGEEMHDKLLAAIAESMPEEAATYAALPEG